MRRGRAAGVLLAVLWALAPGAVRAEAQLAPCPEGTERRGEPPPGGRETGCARREGDAWVRHGPWQRFDAAGREVERAAYRDGRLDGALLRRHPDGRVAFEGSFRLGRADGVHQRFAPDGTRTEEARYSDGALEGWLLAWHAHGARAAEVRYRAGRAQGPASAWFPDGGPRFEGEHRDGLRHGTWKFWYRRGALDLVGDYAEGLRHGAFVRRWPGGRTWWEGSFRRGRRHGPFRYWDPHGGLVAEGSYRDGLREGSWRFHASGQAQPRVVDYRAGRLGHGDPDAAETLAEVTPGLAPRLTPARAVALARQELAARGPRPQVPPEPRLRSVSADVPSDADLAESEQSWSVPASFAGVVWRVEFEGRFVRRGALLPDARVVVVEIPDARAGAR